MFIIDDLDPKDEIQNKLINLISQVIIKQFIEKYSDSFILDETTPFLGNRKLFSDFMCDIIPPGEVLISVLQEKLPADQIDVLAKKYNISEDQVLIIAGQFRSFIMENKLKILQSLSVDADIRKKTSKLLYSKVDIFRKWLESLMKDVVEDNRFLFDNVNSQLYQKEDEVSNFIIETIIEGMNENSKNDNFGEFCGERTRAKYSDIKEINILLNALQMKLRDNLNEELKNE